MPFPTETVPTDTGGGKPGGDLLGHILRELEKGIKEGRIKPVIVGPYKIDIPGNDEPTGQAPSGEGQQPAPGSDIFGQILRDLLTGTLGGQKAPAGEAVFGELIEPGKDVDPSQIKTFQDVLDQFKGGAPRRKTITFRVPHGAATGASGRRAVRFGGREPGEPRAYSRAAIDRKTAPPAP